ncbi:MAG: trehalose-6-phosphate synthase [Candidatus Obscuribacterales bacterium]|nr:trehalose-6-phosphate synthase [Candidatus Obscuribacterales bacterium]
MNILSYRGPIGPGGVSGSLSHMFDRHAKSNDTWWYMAGQSMVAQRKTALAPETICRIPDSIVSGHYRYCNNFLWPVLHDMPKHAQFDLSDKASYAELNLAISCNTVAAASNSSRGQYFVHDYQLALLPEYLSAFCPANATMFWHIPWPEEVEDRYVPHIKELASSLLNASQIGFHTAEYASNFRRFVTSNFFDCSVEEGKGALRIVRKQEQSGLTRATALLVHPLGIDFDRWTQLSNESGENGLPDSFNSNSTFILSVDRADYTKGIIERLKAIDLFFEKNAQWLTKVQFLQVTQRSRTGLPAFDSYWSECTTLAAQINNRWRNDEWAPIVWLTEPLDMPTLARLYRSATALCVSSVRDGLNLTAKEFIACSGADSKVILLSSHAGVWDELQRYVLTLAPSSPLQVSEQFLAALNMSCDDRKENFQRMRKIISENSTSSWWQSMNRAPATSYPEGFSARRKGEKRLLPI